MNQPFEELVPIRRPHFTLREGRLFFLLSARPFAELEPVEQDVWRRVDGQSPVAAVVAPGSAEESALRRLSSLGVVELVEPALPEGRRRVLVVEPHMDDAVLSVGGLMWSLREECAFSIVTIAERSNFTVYHYLDREYFEVDTVSELREAESRLAARLIGGSHAGLGQSEAPLRCCPGDWTLSWFREHRKLVDATVTHAAPSGELPIWAAVVERAVDDHAWDELWLPLGVGAHCDHELARDAWLHVLSGRPELIDRGPVFLYQDVPYSARFPDHTDRITRALARAGAVLEPAPIDVAGSWEAKERLVSLFGSQFKPAAILPEVREAARLASPDGGGAFELRYRLKRPPVGLDRAELYSGGARVERQRPRVERWLERNRQASRIRVLSAEPLPRPTADLGVLLDALPTATLEVHVRTDHRPSDWVPEDSRIDLREVEAGRRAWLRRLASLAVSARLPTLVVTGPGLERWAGVVRGAFVGADVCAAPTLNDAVLVIDGGGLPKVPAQRSE